MIKKTFIVVYSFRTGLTALSLAKYFLYQQGVQVNEQIIKYLVYHNLKLVRLLQIKTTVKLLCAVVVHRFYVSRL